MKFSIPILFLLLINLNSFAQTKEDYIMNYALIAVSEMESSNIPASITLAQGILESRYGTSELSSKSNNHFGIKCHSTWQGEKVYHADDRADDCFRKYNSPEESFKDHSQFLLRNRYSDLFNLEKDDYKGWAKGLTKAGYATDKSYSKKLIKIIEELDLHIFDKMNSSTTLAYVEQKRNSLTPILASKKPIVTTVDKKPVNNTKPIVITTAKNKKEVLTVAATPPSPPSEPIPQTVSNDASKYSKAVRTIFEVNDINTVRSYAQDTPNSIAELYDIKYRRLVAYNEWDEYRSEFKSGMNIFLQPKRRKARNKDQKFHTVQSGETMYQIGQQYGIKTKNLYHLNAMDYDRKEQPAAGVQLSLRKRLKQKPRLAPANSLLQQTKMNTPDAQVQTDIQSKKVQTDVPSKEVNVPEVQLNKIPQQNKEKENKNLQQEQKHKILKPAGESISDQLPPEGGTQEVNKRLSIDLEQLYQEQLLSNEEQYQGRAIIYEPTPVINQQPVPIYKGSVSTSVYQSNSSSFEDVTQPNNETSSITYRVKKGDTLYSIAIKNKVSVAQIKQWNNLKSNNIQIGQRLSLKK